MKSSCVARCCLATALILCVGALSGCSGLVKLSSDLRETARDIRLVSGTVTSPACRDCETIIVVLADEAGSSVDNYRVFERPGAFRLAALATSRYLFAFQDLNGDFEFQSDEPSGWFDLRDASFFFGQAEDIGIVLSGDAGRRRPASLGNLFDLRGSTLGRVDVQLGKPARLDDARFSPEAAAMGMWQPLRFMKEGYAGIYFLEPYAADKTPVLFVHGIAGSPRDLDDVIAVLDRRRFQPWLMNFPSGLDIRALGDGLVGLLAELRHRFGFAELHIVAHSMGAVVVREYLAECARSGGCDYARRFISISAPFGGDSAARLGVEYAPVVMPVWRSLASDGTFIKRLFDEPLPDSVTHFLVFGFRNSATLRSASGDGVIPLASQLRPEAQTQARALRGFDEDHMSILANQQVLRYIKEILEGRDQRRPARPQRAMPGGL